MRTHGCWLNEWASERTNKQLRKWTVEWERHTQYFQTHMQTHTYIMHSSQSMLYQIGSTLCAASKTTATITKEEISFMLLHTPSYQFGFGVGKTQTKRMSERMNVQERRVKRARAYFSNKTAKKTPDAVFAPMYVCVCVCLCVCVWLPPSREVPSSESAPLSIMLLHTALTNPNNNSTKTHTD